MNTLDAILNRRSIRKFTSQIISKELINQLLEAGMYAPSARNTRAWHFVVIENREVLDRLAVAHPYGKMLMQSTLAILVCGDDSLEETKGYHAVNCSAATQNMLLAAHELEIGSVWLGVYPREQRMLDIATLLELPNKFMPIKLIAFGFPDE